MTSQTIEETQRAWRYVELLFRHRPRTVEEVRRRLSERGFSPGVVGEMVQRLQQAGWLDDVRFARLWVQGRSRRFGPQRLRQELRQRGVAADTIEQVLAETFDEASEVEQARVLASEWLERRDHLDPLKRKRRLCGWLQRRGYRGEVVSRVLRGLGL